MLRSRNGCLKVTRSSTLPLKRASSVVCAKLAGGDDGGGKLGGDDVDRARPIGARSPAGGERHVFEVGMEGDGHRRGQGPRRGGPDDGVDLAAGERGVDGCRARR